MIEFKIIATADRTQMSTYQHLGKELTMGQSEGDMIIDDPMLAPLQIKISRQGAGYVIENLAQDVEVRLNGKPVYDPMPLKEKDNVNLGRTVINFSRLDSSGLQPPPKFEHPNAAARFAAGTKEKAILDALEAQAGKELGVSAPPIPGGAGKAPPPLPGGVKPPLPPRK